MIAHFPEVNHQLLSLSEEIHAGERSELTSLTMKLCHDHIWTVLSACLLHDVGGESVVPIRDSTLYLLMTDSKQYSLKQ